MTMPSDPGLIAPTNLHASATAESIDTTRPEMNAGALLQIIGYAARRVRVAALVYDDPVIQELTGHRAKTTLNKMALDSVIAGIVERMRLIMRSAVWTLKPGGDADIDKQFRDHCADGIENLEGGFQAVIGSSATKIVWGFALFEQVFKRQDDGLYQWAAFLPRDQQTVWDWVVEPHTGRLIKVIQQTDDGFHAEIPAWKLLHFRTEPIAGRPEGRPLVRNAYLAWVDKQELRRIVKIGVRRDLVGTPVVTVPPELLSDDASDEEKALLASVMQMIEEVEQDQRSGIAFPAAMDAEGRDTGWKFELMKSPGSRQLKLEELWSLHDQQIAISLMSEVVLYGTQNVGSYALADIKTSTIAKAAGAWLDDDAEFMRTRACRTMQLLNPKFAAAKLPKFEHGPLDPMSLEDLSSFVSKLGIGGFITADKNLEDHLRQKAELPELVAGAAYVPPVLGDPGAGPNPDGSKDPNGKPVPGKKKDPAGNSAEHEL